MIMQTIQIFYFSISQVSDIMKEVPTIKEDIIYVLHEDIITKSLQGNTFYVVTLRRGRTRTHARTREQLLLQNYKA